MSQSFMNNIVQWIHPKDDESNIISATFHMITITLLSMSLVDLTWFSISGDVCVPYLTLGQFFWFGFSNDASIDYSGKMKLCLFLKRLIRSMMFCILGGKVVCSA